MRHLTAVLTSLALLLLCGAEARAFDQDACKRSNTTILLARLGTGFKVVFLLERDGDTIRGAAQAWQINGITAGHGQVTGMFGGTAPVGRGLVLEVFWEGRQDISSTWFKGYLHRGAGDGTALDLAKLVPVPMKLSTTTRCARWPEYDAAFCQDYASKAVAAAHQGHDLGCANDTGRWSTVDRLHFDWCMSLGAEDTVPNSETAVRTQELDACRARRGEIQAKPLGNVKDVVKPAADPADPGIVPKPRFDPTKLR